MLCAASSVIFLLLLPTTGFAHVRLIYPPARYPALDFISNQHSTSPCGVTKPAKDTSSVWIRSGQPLNVTWFSSAPYHGGYRIELLDETDETIALLTDGTNFVGVNDTS
ncbi:unnamed protein product [Anisakis simplex]|uniref:Secreted protein n=1 Tax=Anisakis simplex TaxID=6269 RepID=A0A0M3KAD5_ANISI|nr:unnamed protein product [Anisakis simplex]